MEMSLGAHFSSFPPTADSAVLGSCRYEIKACPPALHLLFRQLKLNVSMFSMLPAKGGKRIISQTALGAVLVWEESGSAQAFYSCLM